MVRFLLAGLSMAALVAPGTACSTDRTIAMAKSVSPPPSQDGTASETMAIVVQAGARELWSGTLRIGRRYGNASASMSKNEAAEPCPGDAPDDSNRSMMSFRLNVSISRHNWQQEPNKFNVNVNWVEPLPACQGEGTNTLGINRVVEVLPGKTVSVEGVEGLVVKVMRQP